MTAAAGGSVEREITLAIVSDQAASVAEKIAELESLGDYILVPRGWVLFRDVYFDTSVRGLGNQGWALRVRTRESECLVALKGPSKQSRWGGVERTEIEAPWSGEAILRILNELALELPSAVDFGDFDPGDPATFMISLGFDAVQTRRVKRLIKDVLSPGGEPVVAEMAIDEVCYIYPGAEVIHWEIEIEARGDFPDSSLQVLANELVDGFGPVLLKWDHGKLATGLALEKLVASPGGRDSILSGNRLRPHAYTIVDALLRRLEPEL